MTFHETRAQLQRPKPGDELERFDAWNISADFVTDDTRAVKGAIERAQFHHRHATLSRSAVIIDGRPHAGKTAAVLGTALKQTVAAHSAPPPHPYSHHLCPWVYVEVGVHSGQLSVAKTIAQQMRVVEGSLRSASDYLAAIRHLAPRVGLQGLIIDDTHAMSGAKSTAKSTTWATTLKGLITGVPTTTVIIGADLERNKILTGTTGEQVRLSAYGRLVCGQWRYPDAQVTTGWERLVKEARDRLAFPDGTSQFRLGTRKTIRLLAEGSDGRPGLAIKWIKSAATDAIINGTCLDLSALESTAHVIEAQVNETAP